MISNEEMVIFIKEINLLINDYNRCDDILVKKQIYDDILLLNKVLTNRPLT